MSRTQSKGKTGEKELKELSLNIVLVEPQIPQNTGNVSRTCVLTGSTLHLVGPMGFSIDDSKLKRAGLDYWKHLRLKTWQNWAEFREHHAGEKLLMFSTRGSSSYAEHKYSPSDYLLFGSETSGLPPQCLAEGTGEKGTILRIPMTSVIKRSLNLSNTVAIVTYEALRQFGFPGME